VWAYRVYINTALCCITLHPFLLRTLLLYMQLLIAGCQSIDLQAALRYGKQELSFSWDFLCVHVSDLCLFTVTCLGICCLLDSGAERMLRVFRWVDPGTFMFVGPEIVAKQSRFVSEESKTSTISKSSIAAFVKRRPGPKILP